MQFACLLLFLLPKNQNRMKRLQYGLAVLAMLLIGGSASAQTSYRQETQGEASLRMPYVDMMQYRHHVSLAYGIVSVYDVDPMLGGLFPELEASGLDEGVSMGAVTLGYTYQLSEQLSVGGMFSYAGSLGVIHYIPNSLRVSQNFFSIMPQVKYNWLERGSWRLYSRASAGVVVAHVNYQDGAELNEQQTAVSFAFQVSPIGFEFGRTLAGFVEAGFGATGVLSVGIRKSF